MKKQLPVIVLVLVALLISSLSVAFAQDDEMARVRIAHLAVDGPRVDVFVGEDVSFFELEYRTLTRYLEIEAGEYEVAVAPSGAGLAGAVIGPVTLPLMAGHDYTIAAIGQLADESFAPLVIDETAQFSGDEEVASVLLLHGISDAPAVDVVLPDGTVMLEGLEFGSFAALDVPAGDYALQVTAAGAPDTVLFDLPDLTLDAGTLTFVAAVGSYPDDATLVSEVTPVATCYISTLSGNINRRAGPGTNYDLEGLLMAGTAAVADGQLMGEGNFIWWRLDDGSWIRADLVREDGPCSALPDVDLREVLEAPATQEAAPEAPAPEEPAPAATEESSS